MVNPEEFKMKQNEANEANALILKQNKANEAVNVNVNVNDTVTVNANVIVSVIGIVSYKGIYGSFQVMPFTALVRSYV